MSNSKKLDKTLRRYNKSRPKLGKEDIPTIKELAKIQITTSELASYFEVCEATIKNFLQKEPEAREALEAGREYGKMSLRRWQLDAARKGNSKMLEWLGKVYLKQKEEQDINYTQKTEYNFSDDDVKRIAKAVIEEEDE